VIKQASEDLDISVEQYHELLSSYFENMTAFSLFRPDMMRSKLCGIDSRTQIAALLASMFSFSARFTTSTPPPGLFADVASTLIATSLADNDDVPPHLALLQAHILVTFYQLTRSCRSKAWRTLGFCVRLAYDMHLHVTDVGQDHTKPSIDAADAAKWVMLEERRRAWWAIWECDVFASTIRRLPTAIDWTQNRVFLPVDDESWFSSTYRPSCYLAEEPTLRWKALEEVRNTSPKAWFIVFNSLMRNAQAMSHSLPSTSTRPPSRHGRPQQSDYHLQADMDIMSNALYCTTTALPSTTAFTSQTLNFNPAQESPSTPSSRMQDAERYSIHLMTQLVKFMTNYHKIFTRTTWASNASQQQQHDVTSGDLATEWSNYFTASDEIVRTIRSSAREHYKYVNPFLVNSVWFAASAQCARKVFGPAHSRRTAESNLVLLRLTIDRYISFWGCLDTLQAKLDTMEAGLRCLTCQRDQEGGRRPAMGREGSDCAVEGRVSVEGAGSRTPSGGVGDPRVVMLRPPDPSPPQQGVQQQSLETMGNAGFHHQWDFQQPYAMLGPAFSADTFNDPFPFGLEELLMYGTNR